MTTVTELCEAYGFSRSTALRHVKACFGDAPKVDGVVRLDASQMHQLTHYLAGKTDKVTRHDASNDAPATRHDASNDAPFDAEMLQEIAALREHVSGLERENELLRERLEISDAALEREQMQARGFWSKLGQRLLGGGNE